MSRHAASWLLIGVVTLYSSAIWADTSCISTVQSAQQSIVQNAYRSQQLKPAWISQSLNRLLQADARCAQASGGICRLDEEAAGGDRAVDRPGIGTGEDLGRSGLDRRRRRQVGRGQQGRIDRLSVARRLISGSDKRCSRRSDPAAAFFQDAAFAGCETSTTDKARSRPSRSGQLIDCPRRNPISPAPIGVRIDMRPAAISASCG